MIKSVAVFLGSAGPDKQALDLAYEFGSRLAREGFKVIFGGAKVGTMEAFAQGCLDNGGEVIGVFPKGFGGKREVAAKGIQITMDCTRNIEVKDLAERKAVMNELCDCCVVLPGGFGTMEELFCFGVENEIGHHDKRAFVLDANGYYSHLEAQLEEMKRRGFLRSDSDVITFYPTIDSLVSCLKSL